MPALTLVFDEPAWPDLAPLAEGPELIEPLTDSAVQVAYLEAGMDSGEPSVAIRIDIAPDQAVVAQTSLALFRSAAAGMEARRGREPGTVGQRFMGEVKAMRAIAESGLIVDADPLAIKRLIERLLEFEEAA